MVLQAAVASSESEGIQGSSLQLRFFAGEVLWAWVLLQIVGLHPGFSTNLRGTGTCFPVIVSIDWVVEEERVLVEVVLGLFDLHSGGQGERIFRCLLVLNVVDVWHRGWSKLTHVLLLGQLGDKAFSLVFSLSLREGEGGSGLLDRQRKLAERGVGLLGIKCLSQCCQISKG